MKVWVLGNVIADPDLATARNPANDPALADWFAHAMLQQICAEGTTGVHKLRYCALSIDEQELDVVVAKCFVDDVGDLLKELGAIVDTGGVLPEAIDQCQLARQALDPGFWLRHSMGGFSTHTRLRSGIGGAAEQ
jgi:hypothetical protein